MMAVIAQSVKDVFCGDTQLLSGAKGAATYSTALDTTDLQPPLILLREEGPSIVPERAWGGLAPLGNSHYAVGFILVKKKFASVA
jgi:hypothetical protein